MKNKQEETIQIEFNQTHLGVLIDALETYSRLQSGQIKMALDTVYADRDISYEEGQYLENAIRYIAFPANPKREYDGHGGFYDQYNNVYDECGNIVEESEMWKKKKNFPHLDHPNSSFGVGCPEMKRGTIAYEIKKIISQYIHYKRNDGYRNIMNVDGDGLIGSYSGIPKPKIIGFLPQKEFIIPKRYQDKIEKYANQKRWDMMWETVSSAFSKKPLPKGSSSRIIKSEDGVWKVLVEEPYKLNSQL